MGAEWLQNACRFCSGSNMVIDSLCTMLYYADNMICQVNARRSFALPLSATLMMAFLQAATAEPATDCDGRAAALLSQMTLEEKLGQMTQVDMNALKDKADIQKFFFGSMLS